MKEAFQPDQPDYDLSRDLASCIPDSEPSMQEVDRERKAEGKMLRSDFFRKKIFIINAKDMKTLTMEKSSYAIKLLSRIEKYNKIAGTPVSDAELITMRALRGEIQAFLDSVS